MRAFRLYLVLAAVCLLAGACSDDDPGQPRPFSVIVQVTDTDGLPVEGLRVGLVNDHPFFQDGGLATKAAVSIPFQIINEAAIRLTIEDIEGGIVRVVSEGAFPGGRHQMIWDGRDDQGIHQPSGRYTAHLVAMNSSSGDTVFEDKVDMLLSMLDSAQVPTGFTDQDGKLVLKDKKLFPHLYDRPAMVATDENGTTLGLLNLTPMMRISLTDTIAGESMGLKEEVIKGTVLKLVWDPQGKRPEEPVFQGVALTDTTRPPTSTLGPVSPNPFN